MKKFAIQFVVLTVIVLAALYATFNATLIDTLVKSQGLVENTPQATKKVKVGETIINVEVADTAELRAKGLGGRASMDSQSGMLFVFPETKKYQFWMKGLSFPLDFIWITNGRVTDILKNIPMPSAGQSDQNLPVYEPVVPVNQMVEVNAGFVDAHNIKVGDIVELLP